MPNTAHHSLKGLKSSVQTLLEEFSSLSIQGEPPPTEVSPPPPCPIAAIPDELLVEILLNVALHDVASFARLAQVCKRLAYLVMTEDRIWKRISLGSEFGFAAMHYTWACQLDGTPLGDDGERGYLLGGGDDVLEGEEELAEQTPPTISTALTPLLVPSIYPTYRTLFRLRPRIRFNGCYISTVNYTRAGAASPTVTSWNTPIHIVTYYRYLRFFRDGTCISLLTLSEPADVIPYLHPENVHKNHGSLPTAPMKDALWGRWRLSGPALPGDTTVADSQSRVETEGTLHVETDGVIPKYLYKMVLSVAGGNRTKNNKLNWQEYWSYNKLIDDWAEFGMKNYRPFYWSRVKSYGMGLDAGVRERD